VASSPVQDAHAGKFYSLSLDLHHLSLMKKLFFLVLVETVLIILGDNIFFSMCGLD
jgi:hypothetical protein